LNVGRAVNLDKGCQLVMRLITVTLVSFYF